MLIDALVQVFGADLPVFALLFLGIVVEKHYVSRVTVFTNVIALNMSLLSLDYAPRFLILYGDIGLILGVYGVTAYLLNAKTWRAYNIPAFFAYASLPVAAVVLAAPENWFTSLLLGGVANAAIAMILKSELNLSIMHWGPRAGPVSRFIKTNKMEYFDGRVNREVDLSLGNFKRR
ncbi:hypothetical protein [Halosegnis longus]|uniref:hypothetical protein n=1 Tax=Halosegnis longus TaxID=2216012 RepID=UPI00096A958B|nr:hypothetical protein [Salella cibi]